MAAALTSASGEVLITDDVDTSAMTERWWSVRVLARTVMGADPSGRPVPQLGVLDEPEDVFVNSDMILMVAPCDPPPSKAAMTLVEGTVTGLQVP